MTTWNDIRLPAHADRLWELYHENSKTSSFQSIEARQNKELQETLANMHISLPVQSAWSSELKHETDLHVELLSAIQESEPQKTKSSALTFEKLTSILYYSSRFLTAASGVTQLCPLEVFGWMQSVEHIPSGVFYMDRALNRIHLLQGSENADRLSVSFPGQQMARAYLFITAIFQRSTMLFGERGYRFALTESGRLLQSILLSAGALDISANQVMQYYERPIEALIGINGVDHALLQVVALGS